MNGEDEGWKTKLGVGGTPLVTMYLHKTNVFFEKFNGKDYL
jgi:hypothetical protein